MNSLLDYFSLTGFSTKTKFIRDFGDLEELGSLKELVLSGKEQKALKREEAQSIGKNRKRNKQAKKSRKKNRKRIK